jgi:predicted TIM-barrel fold metal-dependent hydrolase
MAKTDKSKYSPFDDRVPYDLLEKLRVLKDNNLIFEAQLYPEQFLPLLKLINTSGVIMAIEHFGLPIFGDNSNLVEWHSLINQIAQNKKWYLKLSGFDLNNNFKYLKIALEVVFQNIQSNRLCYGSNFPVSHIDNYRNWSDILKNNIKDGNMSNDIFFNTAHELYSCNEF